MSAARSALYRGRVVHRRLKPVRHRLEYRVFSILLDVDEIAALTERFRWLSRNRFNLFSIHDRDFGDRITPIEEYARDQFRAAGFAAEGRIEMLCYPRMLGYVFNPLTAYFLRDAANKVIATLYEVSNTFGGRHSYLIPAGGGAVLRQEADKRFHVSPFMEMETRYHFRIAPPAEDVAVAIRQTDAEGAVLNAAFVGAREPLSDASLLRAFRDYPLMTLKVIAGIHFEAARLMAKGLRLLKGAPDPAEGVTVLGAETDARRAA